MVWHLPCLLLGRLSHDNNPDENWNPSCVSFIGRKGLQNPLYLIPFQEEKIKQLKIQNTKPRASVPLYPKVIFSAELENLVIVSQRFNLWLQGRSIPVGKKKVHDEFLLGLSRFLGSLQWINMCLVSDGMWALFQPEKLLQSSTLTSELTGVVTWPVSIIEPLLSIWSGLVSLLTSVFWFLQLVCKTCSTSLFYCFLEHQLPGQMFLRMRSTKVLS